MAGGALRAQAALPNWSTAVSLESSYGYKDNLLLSWTDAERSAFVRGEVEVIVLRVPTGPFDYSLYAQADRTHFFSGRSVDHEAQAWVSSDAGYRVGNWRLSLPVTGYYTDRVLDASDTDLERIATELKEVGAMVGPTVRWNLHKAWWLELQAVGQRRYFDERAFNSKVGEGAVRLGWVPHERAEVRLSAIERWRAFADRSQYNRAGRELVGTQLKIAEREGELRFDLKLGRTEAWRTITRANVLDYRDNGSGYFSFRERQIGQELEWTGQRWLVRLGGSARRVDYKVQSVGFGFSPTPRVRDEFQVDAHVERKLSGRWTVFTSYRWERSRSNDRFASYRVNEGLLGARWSWEK